jgi:UDP-N-acetylmuramate dehydrogenase
MIYNTTTMITSKQWHKLESTFGVNLQREVLLARFTASRVGGPADALLTAKSVDQLASFATSLWDIRIPFVVLGGGSNVLISDHGVRQVVILNRAKEIEIDPAKNSVWAGSGANFGQVARKVSSRGLSGLEWASGIPGTVGGAVFGNSGAHGSDVAGSLLVAEILHQASGRTHWTTEQFGYAYRSSVLKRDAVEAVILSARFRLTPSTTEATQSLMDEYASWRRKTQPPGASMGSMFKNPNGDFAGRLIDQCGLKGTRLGDAEISPVHANFFVNHGGAKARDVLTLIKLAQKEVYDHFGVKLALEIELLGEWEADEVPA